MKKVHWHAPALGLTFLKEPSSCALHSALHRKAPTSVSSTVPQNVAELFRRTHPVFPEFQATHPLDDTCLLVTLAAFLSLQEVLAFQAVSLTTEIPRFNSCCAETVWHVVVEDVMVFWDSSPATQDTDENQVATHGNSAGPQLQTVLLAW